MSDEPNIQSSEIQVDGVWRPEEWKNGKFLLVRYLPADSGITQRQLWTDTSFGSFATIFESEANAQVKADQLNEAAVAALAEAAAAAAASSPPSSGDSTEENDQ